MTTNLPFETGDVILMIGDSITESGRDAQGEAAPGWGPGLGKGYVTEIDALLRVFHGQTKVRIINRGVSGHTVRDLAARWTTDVLALKPDWVSIGVGVNDVWRQFDSPLRADAGVPAAEFESTYRKLVDSVRSSVKGVFLISPFFMEPNRNDPLRARMDEYGEIVRRIAADTGSFFVDIQTPLDQLCAFAHPVEIASDRIHPSHAGHVAMALAWLEAAGLRITLQPAQNGQTPKGDAVVPR